MDQGPRALRLATHTHRGAATISTAESWCGRLRSSRIRMFGHIEGRLHVAIMTLRGEQLRVISLRRANQREECAYAKERQSS